MGETTFVYLNLIAVLRMDTWMNDQKPEDKIPVNWFVAFCTILSTIILVSNLGSIILLSILFAFGKIPAGVCFLC